MKVSLQTTYVMAEDNVAGHTWVTCRVCLMRAKVSVLAPALLCNPCRIDLALTRAHIETVLGAIEARYRAAMDHWAILVEPHTARWETVWAAKLEMETTVFTRRWERTIAAGGEFGLVLQAWDAAGVIGEELTQRRAWAAAAFEEIAAYEQG